MMGTDHKITGPINLGNPVEFKVSELARKVIEMTNSKSEIVFHQLPVDDPTQRRPDIRLAQEVLGWKPKIELQDGLRETTKYFSNLLNH